MNDNQFSPQYASMGQGQGQKRTSGLGISALIIGIVACLIAWIPYCGSLPGGFAALVGTILGACGWNVARGRSDVGKGVPIAGTLICLLGLGIAAAATLVPSLLIWRTGAAAIDAHERNQARAEALRLRYATGAPGIPETRLYAGASPSHLAGTGFLITADDLVLGVTAKHPFGQETPESFIDFGDNSEGGDVALGKRVAEWIDVQVFEVPDPPAGVEPLPYPGPMPVRKGDVIVLLTETGPVEGTVTSDPGNAIPGQATLASPRFVMGASGSPILLKATGTVVGLLVGADDPEEATVVDFVRLSLQTEESKAAGTQ